MSLPLSRINSNRHGFEVLDVSLVNQDSSQPVTDKLPIPLINPTTLTIQQAKLLRINASSSLFIQSM